MERIPEALRQEPSRPAKAERRERQVQLEKINRMRGECLDELLTLETVRNSRRKMNPDDIHTLDVLVETRPQLLDPRALKDIRDTLTVMETVHDMAADTITFIELLNDEEVRLRELEGQGDEERERASDARAQHVNVLKQEWSVS